MTQPRAAVPTISFIDQYCSQYQTTFPKFTRIFAAHPPETFQLLLLPLLAFNLIKPWLTVFGNPLLEQSFNTLIAYVNLCSYAFNSS
jgi:hypothetical protein